MQKAAARTHSGADTPPAFPTGAELCKSVKIPLPRAPISMVRRLAQITLAIAAEVFEAEDWNVLEFGVLMHLSREPDLDQISLAARIGVDRTNIGVILDRMEKRGMIDRHVDAQDRRARIPRLTRLGADTLARLAPKTAHIRDKLFAPLTERERETFYDLLERMIAANEHYSQAGAGRRKRQG